MSQIHIIRPTSNVTVTFNNFNILSEAAISTGCLVNDNSNIHDALSKPKSDIYIVTSMDDVIKLRLSGRRKIFYWVQGVVPEESYMRHHSRIRYAIISIQEFLALKFAKVIAPVSNAMLDHYKNKYHIKIDNSYVFPCFNTTLSKDAIFNDVSKYRNNIFVYAGGLAVWQCFDQTLEIYKRFEDLCLPNTKLIVLTKDKELAIEKIQKTGIRHYETNFVKPEELPTILSCAKFGFVIREDDPVNRVSTPTKISTYLSCGLIPIFGSCIHSFAEKSETMNYVAPWDGSSRCFERVKSFMESEIEADKVYKEYSALFNEYFSNRCHQENITKILKQMIYETNN